MIFAVSRHGCDHSFFSYRCSIDGLIVDSSTPLQDVNNFGYRLADKESGNWWQILLTEGLCLTRSVSADYHWGQGNDILVTNFWPLIKQRFNPLVVQITFDRDANRFCKLHRLKESEIQNNIQSAVDLVAARLSNNIDYLVENYDCKAVAWSQGLDTMCNHRLRSDLDLAIASSFQGWLPSGKHCIRSDLSMSKNEPWFCPGHNSVALQTNLAIIDGFYGDAALCRSPSLGLWAMQNLGMHIDPQDIYQTPNVNEIPSAMSWTKLKQTLVNNFLNMPRHGIFSNSTIFDPYRDHKILQIVLTLSNKDLCLQMNTACIQKQILAESDLIGNKFKNDPTITVHY